MSEGNKTDYFKSIQKDYMDCIKQVLSVALFEAWGEDWFNILKAKDIEQVDGINQKKKEKMETKGKDFTPAPYTLKKYSEIKKLDFQACSKVLYYLPEVWKIVCEYYGKADCVGDRAYKDALNRLMEFRNVKVGHDSMEDETSTDDAELIENGIADIRLILKDVFCDIVNPKDKALRTYYLIFENHRMLYERELYQKSYLLSKYLDYENYDHDKFYEACQSLHITAKMVEGQNVFYTANLEEDLEKLKNALAKKPIAPKTVIKEEQIIVKKSNDSLYKILIAIICLVCLVIIALFAANSLSKAPYDSPVSSDKTSVQSSEVKTPASSKEPSSSVVQSVQSDTDSKPEEDKEPKGENQLGSEFEQEVENFQYSDKMTQRLNTITLRVGEKRTPSAASVWTGSEIFSQNTGVAVADGIIVKGVAKGETYIVVEAPTGMTQVYKVVVE